MANISATAGGIVTIITLITMIVSKGLRHWIRQHPFDIFWALLVLTIAVMVLVNYIFASKRTYNSSDAQANNDNDLLAHFVVVLAPDGSIMKWLKQSFNPAAIPRASVQALKEVKNNLALNPLAYRDAKINRAYIELRKMVEQFCAALDHMTLDRRGEFYYVPEDENLETTEHVDALVQEIQASRDSLVGAYDGFIRLCYRRGMSFLGARRNDVR